MSKGRAAAIDRLSHMRDSCLAIADYVGRGRSTFDADAAVRDAILYQVVVSARRRRPHSRPIRRWRRSCPRSSGRRLPGCVTA